MKPLSRGIACACLLLVIASVSRCGPGQRYRSARKAEERGDIHVAYDDYCQAARKRAGNGAVAAGIKRTSAAAAATIRSATAMPIHPTSADTGSFATT